VVERAPAPEMTALASTTATATPLELAQLATRRLTACAADSSAATFRCTDAVAPHAPAAGGAGAASPEVAAAGVGARGGQASMGLARVRGFTFFCFPLWL
jgi:curli biogenesis system outer membrane secretion channel CsgG